MLSSRDALVRDLALLFRLALSIFLSRFLTKNLDSTASNDELLFWLDPKSPLERGGPPAVGSVCFEKRFQLRFFLMRKKVFAS